MLTTQHLGRADSVKVESDENGFKLHISTDTGSYVVNIHGVATQLLQAVDKEIGEWLAEGYAARMEHSRHLTAVIDAGGYDVSDPKHPDWHSVHADLYDSRLGK